MKVEGDFGMRQLRQVITILILSLGLISPAVTIFLGCFLPRNMVLRLLKVHNRIQIRPYVFS